MPHCCYWCHELTTYSSGSAIPKVIFPNKIFPILGWHSHYLCIRIQLFIIMPFKWARAVSYSLEVALRTNLINSHDNSRPYTLNVNLSVLIQKITFAICYTLNSRKLHVSSLLRLERPDLCWQCLLNYCRIISSCIYKQNEMTFTL